MLWNLCNWVDVYFHSWKVIAPILGACLKNQLAIWQSGVFDNTICMLWFEFFLGLKFFKPV